MIGINMTPLTLKILVWGLGFRVRVWFGGVVPQEHSLRD